MKYTGIAVILIGACILLFCIVASATGQPVQQAPEAASAKMDLMFPVIMGVVALVAGVVMYLYGGRGYISTRNPAIRN